MSARRIARELAVILLPQLPKDKKKLEKVELDRLVSKAVQMLTDYGLGGIAEVYDGDEPHRPGGCPWQAWSVGEILRAWIEDVGGD